MKQIYGKAHNINEDIIGRITFGKSNPFARSNDILVCDNATKLAFGYSATITNNPLVSDNGKPYIIVDDLNGFHEEDVVILNQKGEIIFVYEISSCHNAIMG